MLPRDGKSKPMSTIESDKSELVEIEEVFFYILYSIETVKGD